MFNVIKKVVFLQPHFTRDEHRGVAQLASALAWGARGRKFESFHPDNFKKEFRFTGTLFYLQKKLQSDFPDIHDYRAEDK